MANTTCLDIVTRALRILGVIGAGEAPGPQDGQDAMLHLQEMIDGLPMLRTGPWTEVRLPSAAAYTAKDGERVNTRGYAAAITLPDTYEDEDGATVSQRDMSRVQIIGGDQAGLWLYAASRGAWSKIDGLELSSDLPFGKEDDAGMVALLAVTMAPEFSDGGDVAPVVVERAAKQMRSLRARLRRTTHAPVADGYLNMSDTGNAGLYDPDTL